MKWFFLNATNRFFFATRHPVYAIRVLLRELVLADERFLASVTGSTTAEIRTFLSEPFTIPGFLDYMKRCESMLGEMESPGAAFYAKKVLIQYAIVRALKPDIVVETGVANGVSTTYLLLALEKNEKGNLHSIDIGDGSFLPPGRTPGWIVPDWLNARWTLHLGDARDVLPNLLKQLGQIDLFIHDSIHMYHHMMFEFQQTYPFLKTGGLLLADDALWNSAFKDFAKAVKAYDVSIIRGVGVLRK